MASFTARIPYGGFSFSASSSSNGWRAGVSPHVDSARQTGARGSPVILELPLDKIRRPLMRTRANDPNKVQELIDSIRLIALQILIDVLEVDGVYYGLFPDADSLSFLIICIEALLHLATVKVDDLLYFVVLQASPAVIGTKLIGASASLPSVAIFAREQRRP